MIVVALVLLALTAGVALVPAGDRVRLWVPTAGVISTSVNPAFNMSVLNAASYVP